MLPTPKFHHIRLNAVDPEAAIGWYTRQFACARAGEWADTWRSFPTTT